MILYLVTNVKFATLNNNEVRYDMNKQGVYHVVVFDINGVKVDEMYDIVAWSRREAYFDARYTLKPHNTWDATRYKDY